MHQSTSHYHIYSRNFAFIVFICLLYFIFLPPSRGRSGTHGPTSCHCIAAREFKSFPLSIKISLDAHDFFFFFFFPRRVIHFVPATTSLLLKLSFLLSFFEILFFFFAGRFLHEVNSLLPDTEGKKGKRRERERRGRCTPLLKSRYFSANETCIAQARLAK